MEKKKFIFDLDGTVTAEETLPLIAKHFHVQEEIETLTIETIQGNIPFIESFIRRVTILGKIPVSQVADLLEHVCLHQELFNFIQIHTQLCVITTGNLRSWSYKLLHRIGCEYFCSEAEIENDEIVKLTKILRKEQIVEKYQNEGYEVIYVGDGNNDLEAMRIADISIAIGMIHSPSRSLMPVSDYLIFNEQALCRQLNQLL
ncbi:Phosphoserine phosphatase [termite gut metagenome]|uniref:phosphoserine phosphatase n=1 Tax=termite gut metagenome TaxID=433724 RepID=A0A5J4QHH6_9ZZZZ